MSSNLEVLLPTRQLGQNLVLPVGRRDTSIDDNEKRLLAKLRSNDA